MRLQWILPLLLVPSVTALGQEPAPPPIDASPNAAAVQEIFATPPEICCDDESGRSRLRNRLAGDRDFPNFIGFVSNPTLSIDPRALSQIWPTFVNVWTTQQNRIPAGDVQVYGPGMSIALGERLSVGASKGGYAVSNIRQSRDGFLDTGFFAQYALIRNVEKQFILTAGMQVITQWLGSRELFQGGYDPAKLSPYITFGKEIGEFHILGTVGYQFPVARETISTRTWYANLHFDRRCFGWLYPLVEFNSAWTDISIDSPRLDEIRGFFDLGRYDATGGIVTVAAGANAVIVHNRLELGAVYQTPIYSEANFRFHELLVKMILRF